MCSCVALAAAVGFPYGICLDSAVFFCAGVRKSRALYCASLAFETSQLGHCGSAARAGITKMTVAANQRVKALRLINGLCDAAPRIQLGRLLADSEPGRGTPEKAKSPQFRS